MKSAVILAGGQSVRFNSNKMLTLIGSKPLISVTVEKFIGIVDEIILVTHYDDIETMNELFGDSVRIVAGGATRTMSAINGLGAVSKNSQYVAIHDGARPFITAELITLLFAEAAAHGNAVPVTPMTDCAYAQQRVGEIHLLEREKICNVQTPQVFLTEKIKEAYQNRDEIKVYHDDSAIFLDRFRTLHFVKGNPCNKKVTYECDLGNLRIGNGYDVHRLEEGRKLILGGVEIPHGKGLVGHSDADVILHAIMDSLLSAANERDIGVQFPPTDDMYKGASSLSLLIQVGQILHSKGAVIQNISCVAAAQEPHLADFIPQICKIIARALNIASGQVSISATTTEQLGVIGKGEAISAQAISLVML